MRRFVCGVAKRPAGLAMEGLRRPTKSRQGAKPDSAKPTQVGSSTRRLSCIARQRLPIPSILSILSHSTPHPQPPHLYKCGGSHAANNEGHRGELRFAAIEACAVKTYAARSRQPFFPFSFAPPGSSLVSSRPHRLHDEQCGTWEWVEERLKVGWVFLWALRPRLRTPHAASVCTAPPPGARQPPPKRTATPQKC